MSAKKKPKKPDGTYRSPMLLERWGTAREFRFDHGGSVRIQMNTSGIKRLLDVLYRDELRSRKKPRHELLTAIETLASHYNVGRRSDICIMVDVPMAVHGVRLEPIIPGINEPHEDEKP